MIKAILLLGAVILCIAGVLASLIAVVVLALRRQAPLAVLSGFLALVCAMLGVAFGGAFVVKSLRAVGRQAVRLGEGRSGRDLFLATVMKQIPRSVEILHSHDDPVPLGLDPAYWLHFRISPEDFPLVLKQHPYGKSEATIADGLEGMHAPQWWRIDSLGVDAEAYRFHRFRPGDNSKVPCESAELWVNKERSEVYFRLIYF